MASSSDTFFRRELTCVEQPPQQFEDRKTFNMDACLGPGFCPQGQFEGKNEKKFMRRTHGSVTLVSKNSARGCSLVGNSHEQPVACGCRVFWPLHKVPCLAVRTCQTSCRFKDWNGRGPLGLAVLAGLAIPSPTVRVCARAYPSSGTAWMLAVASSEWCECCDGTTLPPSH